MISKNVQITILSRSLSLISNFLMLVLTARHFGAEGRGIISYVLANVAIVNILTNISSGSTLIYHTPKSNIQQVLLFHFCITTALVLIGALFMSAVSHWQYTTQIFFLSVGYGLVNGVINIFQGKKLYLLYNAFSTLLNVLPLALFSLCLLAGVFVNVNAFFYCMYTTLVLSFLLSIYFLKKHLLFHITKPDIQSWKSFIRYGIKNELSYFFQFLSYRVSYFFIVEKIGLPVLGQFSITTALAESVWIISRSISTVHYTNLLYSDNSASNKKKTHQQAIISLCLSLLMTFILLIVPENWYGFLFGKNFSITRDLLMYFTPGIIAIAFSNVHAHYFSAMGKQNILIIKSLAGFIVNLSLLLFFSNYLKLIMVLIATNASYILSSLLLIYNFYFYDRSK